MPNGNNFTHEEWIRFEGPLKELDLVIQKFSKDNKMELINNYHNWPSRDLKWKNQLSKTITISLDNKDKTKYNFIISANHHVKRKRFSKNVFLKKGVAINEIQDNLVSLLNKAKDILGSWKIENLKRV